MYVYYCILCFFIISCMSMRGISSAYALQHHESLVSPPELFQDLGSLDLRFLNASTEELLKAIEKTLGRPLLDDFANRIRKPDRSELRQRTWSRQRHIDTEPPHHFADAAWKCPMNDEARICCGALQGVQRAGGNDGKRKLQSLHTQLPCNVASLASPSGVRQAL